MEVSGHYYVLAVFEFPVATGSVHLITNVDTELKMNWTEHWLSSYVDNNCTDRAICSTNEYALHNFNFLVQEGLEHTLIQISIPPFLTLPLDGSD
jgi:hypothetical protein